MPPRYAGLAPPEGSWGKTDSPLASLTVGRRPQRLPGHAGRTLPAPRRVGEPADVSAAPVTGPGAHPCGGTSDVLDACVDCPTRCISPAGRSPNHQLTGSAGCWGSCSALRTAASSGNLPSQASRCGRLIKVRSTGHWARSTSRFRNEIKSSRFPQPEPCSRDLQAIRAASGSRRGVRNQVRAVTARPSCEGDPQVLKPRRQPLNVLLAQEIGRVRPRDTRRVECHTLIIAAARQPVYNGCLATCSPVHSSSPAVWGRRHPDAVGLPDSGGGGVPDPCSGHQSSQDRTRPRHTPRPAAVRTNHTCIKLTVAGSHSLLGRGRLSAD